MKSQTRRKGQMALVLIVAAIPLLIILSAYFGLSSAVSVPLIVVLSLVSGALALWTHANKHVDGSEWWQDEDTVGWRGY